MDLKNLTPRCLAAVAVGSLALGMGCTLTIPAEPRPDSQVAPVDAAATDVQADAAPDASVIFLDSGPDAAPDAVVDHSDLLPPGVSPPVLRFWRGIRQNNVSWYTDATGRHCAHGDTTMWFRCPDNQPCGGAPACDADHFETPERVCMGDCCHWRNWDDPRGPEFRVSNNTGPVEIHNQNAQSSTGGVPDLGFGVTLCALPGTTATIDTCPRVDVYSCVEDRAPQWVDDCTTVLLTVADAPPGYAASQAGCYSTVSNVTFTF